MEGGYHYPGGFAFKMRLDELWDLKLGKSSCSLNEN